MNPPFRQPLTVNRYLPAAARPGADCRAGGDCAAADGLRGRRTGPPSVRRFVARRYGGIFPTDRGSRSPRRARIVNILGLIHIPNIPGQRLHAK